jgi:hypothetical protein
MPSRWFQKQLFLELMRACTVTTPEQPFAGMSTRGILARPVRPPGPGVCYYLICGRSRLVFRPSHSCWAAGPPAAWPRALREILPELGSANLVAWSQVCRLRSHSRSPSRICSSSSLRHAGSTGHRGAACSSTQPDAPRPVSFHPNPYLISLRNQDA